VLVCAHMVSREGMDLRAKHCHSNEQIPSHDISFVILPLHVQKLRKVEVQPLIDKIGARLPGWKGRFLSTAERETLVKTVLSSQLICHLTASLNISG
jgi:hypothetical protein